MSFLTRRFVCREILIEIIVVSGGGGEFWTIYKTRKAVMRARAGARLNVEKFIYKLCSAFSSCTTLSTCHVTFELVCYFSSAAA